MLGHLTSSTVSVGTVFSGGEVFGCETCAALIIQQSWSSVSLPRTKSKLFVIGFQMCRKISRAPQG